LVLILMTTFDWEEEGEENEGVVEEEERRT
jgi:hypothetical protein